MKYAKRIFAASEYAMTLEEVAAELGISYERVRQIEKRALEKMRSRFDATCLADVMHADELPDVVMS